MTSTYSAPASVLILGGGEFGLSTAYSLALNPAFKETSITLVDASEFPAQDGASQDVSRLVRSDYADPDYAALAQEAMRKWESSWWGQDAYHNTGVVLCTPGTNETTWSDLPGHQIKAPAEAIWHKYATTQKLGLRPGPRSSGGQLQKLEDRAAIESVINQPPGVQHSSTLCNWQSGYANWTAGWVHASQAMRNLRTKVEELNRVTFVTGQIERLIFAAESGSYVVKGATLSSGRDLVAELTVLATGSWTPSLIDLRGIATSTAHILCYMNITDEEQAALGENPTLIDMASVHFQIPPSDNVIRTAHHAQGYINPQETSYPEPINSFELDISACPSATNGIPPPPATFKISVPWTFRDDRNIRIPADAYKEHLRFLHELYPSTATRQSFDRVRLCWYLDTTKEDFLVTYHPRYSRRHESRAQDGATTATTTKGLFVATGGSGHAFKFLPVLGDKIVAAIMGELESNYADRWTWPKQRRAEEQPRTEGWRGGRSGMVLTDELAKGSQGS